MAFVLKQVIGVGMTDIQSYLRYENFPFRVASAIGVTVPVA